MSIANPAQPEIRPYDVGAMAGRPPSSEAPEFGKKLAELRRRRGLTQAELAKLLGVSEKTVNHYERRTANPSLELIQRLASFLDASPSDLVDVAAELPAPRRSKPGPKSHLEEVVERLHQLPRSEQQRVVEQIEDAVRRAEQRVAG